MFLLLQFAVITILAAMAPAFQNADVSWQRVLFVVLLFSAIGAIVIRKLIRKEAIKLKTFELIVEPDKLIWKQDRKGESHLPFSAVIRIRKQGDDTLLISGKAGKAIHIEGRVNDHELLESLLQSVKPMTTSTAPASGLFIIPMVLSSVALIVGLTGSDVILKKVFVPIIIFLLLAGFAIAQANKKIDRTTRILSWAILLPLAAFLCYLILR